MASSEIYNRRMRDCISSHRHALVGYLTAGYPDRAGFLEIAAECCRRGMSVLEVGFPSDDPYADGDVIREAHRKVDPALARDMDFWRELRGAIQAPIWLMGYRKDLFQTGIYREMAREGLYDVLIIPDLDMAGRVELKRELREFGIDVAGFVSNDDSFHSVTENTEEFPIIYQKLYTGQTGKRNDSEDYQKLLDYGKLSCRSIMFGGFGISTGDRVRELLDHGFFGAIIGTEIMRKLNESPETLYAFIEELSCILREEED